MTSLVPLASLRAAWTSCAAEPSGAVWEAREPAATNSVGIVARPASRLRRETRDGLDASVTVSLLSGLAAIVNPRKVPWCVQPSRGYKVSTRTGRVAYTFPLYLSHHEKAGGPDWRYVAIT